MVNIDMAFFNVSIKFILHHEGGFVDNINDRGGATNFGISQAFLKSIDSKLRPSDLTLDMAKSLYHEYFWSPLRLDEIENQTVATFVFDTAVNCGNSKSSEILQRAIFQQRPIEIDGIIGAKTIKICNEITGNELNEMFLIDCLKSIRKNFYLRIVEKNPEQRVFIKGWFNRVNDFFCIGCVNDDKKTRRSK